MSRELTKGRRKVRIVFMLLAGLGIAVVATSFPLKALSKQHSTISSLSSRLAGIKAANKILEEEATQLENPTVVKDLAVSQFGLNPSSSLVNRAPVVSGSPYGQPIHPVPLSIPPVLPGSALSNSLLGLPGAAPIQWSSSKVSTLGSASRHVSGGSSGFSGDSGSGDSGSGIKGAIGGRTAHHKSFLHRLVSSLEFWR